MPLSDDAYNNFINKWAKHNKEIVHWIISQPVDKTNFKEHFNNSPEPMVEKEKSKGTIIYTPHDCEFPDPSEIAVGTIWACYGYRQNRMCYDQWILVAGENGTKSWQLFERNI